MSTKLVEPKLPREMHPAIERGGALFAPSAGLDAHRVRHSLDGVAQTDFLLDEETRKTDTMGLTLALLPLFLDGFLPFHDAFLPRAEAIT